MRREIEDVHALPVIFELLFKCLDLASEDFHAAEAWRRSRGLGHLG